MLFTKNNEGIRAIWATKYKKYVAGKYTCAREYQRYSSHKIWYDKYEILNKIEKTQLLFTAITTNTRPQGVFSSVQTCLLVDVNQPLPWFSHVGQEKILSPFLKHSEENVGV